MYKDVNLEYPRELPKEVFYPAYGSDTKNRYSENEEESSERINYEQAFEEMKYGDFMDEGVDKPTSSNDYENIYDQFLDKEIDTPHPDSEENNTSNNNNANNADFGFPDNDTSDLRNEMADEYATNEGISLPKQTISARREELELKAEDKVLKHQGSSTNTLGKALTHHKSAESSESLLRSPNLVLAQNANTKAYVLNKTRKQIDNLDKSNKG